MRLRAQKGFTLMETVLAITLFVIVAASSFNIFGMGLQIWKRTRTDSKTEQRVLLALEKMSRDLRGMVRTKAQSDEFSISQEKDVEYGGTETRVQFPAVYAPGENPGGEGYGRTTYEWNSSTKELCRRMESAADLYAKSDPGCRPMASEVLRLKLRYWMPSGLEDSYAWYDNWDPKEALPLAIEINLELQPESRLTGKRVYKKIVVIPVGGKYDPKQ